LLFSYYGTPGATGFRQLPYPAWGTVRDWHSWCRKLAVLIPKRLPMEVERLDIVRHTNQSTSSVNTSLTNRKLFQILGCISLQFGFRESAKQQLPFNFEDGTRTSTDKH
jgi:hypothetical protein